MFPLHPSFSVRPSLLLNDLTSGPWDHGSYHLEDGPTWYCWLSSVDLLNVLDGVGEGTGGWGRAENGSVTSLLSMTGVKGWKLSVMQCLLAPLLLLQENYNRVKNNNHSISEHTLQSTTYNGRELNPSEIELIEPDHTKATLILQLFNNVSMGDW